MSLVTKSFDVEAELRQKPGPNSNRRHTVGPLDQKTLKNQKSLSSNSSQFDHKEVNSNANSRRMTTTSIVIPDLTIDLASSGSDMVSFTFILVSKLFIYPTYFQAINGEENDPFHLSESEREKLTGFRLSIDATGDEMMRKISHQSLRRQGSRTSQRSNRSIRSNSSRRSVSMSPSKHTTGSAKKSTLTQQSHVGRRRSTITRSSNFFGKM